MPAATVDFWFDFASTYSYIAAMRIERLAEAAGVTIDWKPFLLGPIFKAQGWKTSPFNLYPAKGRYMVREMERLAAEHKVPFQMPPVFPQNSLQAARLALVGVEQGWVAPFTKAVYLRRIPRRRRHLRSRGAGGRPARAEARSCADLRAHRGGGPQGAPQGADGPGAGERHLRRAGSFLVGDELFWGNDRLEQALLWGYATAAHVWPVGAALSARERDAMPGLRRA